MCEVTEHKVKLFVPEPQFQGVDGIDQDQDFFVWRPDDTVVCCYGGRLYEGVVRKEPYAHIFWTSGTRPEYEDDETPYMIDTEEEGTGSHALVLYPKDGRRSHWERLWTR